MFSTVHPCLSQSTGRPWITPLSPNGEPFPETARDRGPAPNWTQRLVDSSRTHDRGCERSGARRGAGRWKARCRCLAQLQPRGFAVGCAGLARQASSRPRSTATGALHAPRRIAPRSGAVRGWRPSAWVALPLGWRSVPIRTTEGGSPKRLSAGVESWLRERLPPVRRAAGTSLRRGNVPGVPSGSNVAWDRVCAPAAGTCTEES